MGFPGGSEGKASACNVGNQGSIPGSEEPLEKEMVNPLWYSCLENPMDGEPGRLHGIAKSQTQLSNFTFIFFSLSGGFPPMDQLWLLPLGSDWLLTLSACSTGFHSYTSK